jgi:hypothetical protein
LGGALRVATLFLTVSVLAFHADPARCQATPEVLVSEAFDDEILAPAQKVQTAKVRLAGGWQIHLNPASDSDPSSSEGNLAWVSDVEVDWSLTWTADDPGDPNNHLGTFQLQVDGQTVERITDKFFDTLFLRVAQVDPSMSVVIAEGVDVIPTGSAAVPKQIDDPLQADAQTPLAFWVLTGAPFINGFSITGKLTPTFDDLTPPDPEPEGGWALEEPFFEIIAARTGCGRDDLDCDGVLNVDDNCPTVGNPDQFDGDGDLVGFVCDNCPTVANADQHDPDFDGVGFVCDNCPGGPTSEGGCFPRRGFTCHNPPQRDDDVDEFGNGDGYGFSCDNCPFDHNPSQAPFPGARRGDACLPFGLQFVTNAPPVVPAGGGAAGLLGGLSLASTTSSLTGGITSDPTNTTPLEFECGANNVSVINIGVKLPPGVTATSFAGCDPPSGVEQIGFCGSSTLDSTIFNRGASFVRGPNIGGADLQDPPGVASNFVLLHLVGARDSTSAGFTEPVICFEGDPLVNAGTLSISGPSLSPDAVIAVSNEDFAGFDPEIEMLFDADGEKIEVENVVTATGPTAGTERLLIEVGPDPSDVSGNRRMQITLASPSPSDVVKKLAIGVRSFRGILPAQLGFGGCSGTPVPLLNDFGETINVIPCDADPDLSAGVQPTDLTSLNTYIIPPNDPSLPIDPLDPTAPLADTLYIVATGQYIGGGIEPSLNYPGQRNKLGVLQFTLPSTAPPPALPILHFEGVLRLPGVTAPIEDANFGFIEPTTEVLIRSAAELPTDLDLDGHDDDSDNCVNFANDQTDTGGLLFIGLPDGTGNDCQCGDGSVANDGAVQFGDVEECTDALAGAPVTTETLERCSVTGDVGVDIGDLVTLQLRTSGDTTATISQACQQAVDTP